MPPEFSGCVPTASQKTAEAQDTALRTLLATPGGLTACWICHELPFHDSASATKLAVPGCDSPPASHTPAVAHDTPLRLVNVAPAGFGVVCEAHEVPFHVAARLKLSPELVP